MLRFSVLDLKGCFTITLGIFPETIGNNGKKLAFSFMLKRIKGMLIVVAKSYVIG